MLSEETGEPDQLPALTKSKHPPELFCCRVWWCGVGTAPQSPAGRAGSAGRSPLVCRPPHSPAGWCPACPPASAAPPVRTAPTPSAAATASRTRTTACCTAPPAGPTGGSPPSTPAPAGQAPPVQIRTSDQTEKMLMLVI